MLPTYSTAILATAPIYGHAFTTSDCIDLKWYTDMATGDTGYTQTN